MRSDIFISVIVPVYNGGPQLARCLDALCSSDFRCYEIIVVDDHSTDGSAAEGCWRGLRVLQLAARSGPAAARNHGARCAHGDVLLFVDADVVMRPDTLGRIAALFDERPDVTAAFGSYDDAPDAPGFVSQYKNLLHHFVHQRSSSEAGTFWAGCGAVRRATFESVGGFDEGRYARPSVEDIELGYRLRRAGFHVVLDRGLQVKHLKRWTLLSLLRTDIFNRALPWSRLILESGGLVNDLNLRVRDRVCAGLVGLAFASLALSYFSPLLLAGAMGALAAAFLLNLDLYRFLVARRGVWFAARSFAMQCLYYFYSGVVFALCSGTHALKMARGRALRSRPLVRAKEVNDA